MEEICPYAEECGAFGGQECTAKASESCSPIKSTAASRKIYQDFLKKTCKNCDITQSSPQTIK
jgi:hypothetical protein